MCVPCSLRVCTMWSACVYLTLASVYLTICACVYIGSVCVHLMVNVWLRYGSLFSYLTVCLCVPYLLHVRTLQVCLNLTGLRMCTLPYRCVCTLLVCVYLTGVCVPYHLRARTLQVCVCVPYWCARARCASVASPNNMPARYTRSSEGEEIGLNP